MRLPKTFCLAVMVMAGVAGCSNQGRLREVPRASASLGQPVSEAALAPWNIDVRGPDGRGLPPGGGTAIAGKPIYEAKCAMCHGAEAAGGPMFGTMVGGIGSFKTDKRLVTPGSMYPYAPALFDYIRRAMPMNQPQSLDNDEAYALTAYLLHLNGLVAAQTRMDAATLSAVRMPNRDGFIVDDRPDTRSVRCMSDCSPLRTFPAN